ncbi:hypothetical protein HBI56_029390 [Parastagonospora nodorum]|uniref:Arrestin-like N-terminal domain-containing protein n=2 Tax=Phaeosphaeria nodorum (strain SN15 / ATCC MYA-4574 / FGSC 10173) TaxID=321614 RepID=A0A7U2F267_PHANO|nr:hypothetical protein SNOG_02869 [Parastagonospora nodorum SN15]KAH3919647.1 hypothetical protein HBH56_017000 [Parastagonospora nodorum]EAT89600.2 hypothetical protein SNOG_02869 [Parastagonospora nodorum SN15]KAH3936835.1 hypothetical protein HBH54_017470 [Parastagonospora nodorum]KAH4059450.1 hypothetical protein HBH49_018280 [Parastagonospora nodorum]KAH4120915.1 hypothetical protein HBH47_107870 [Parastagonospora nodorum]
MTSARQPHPHPQPRQLYSYVAQPSLYSDHYPDHENTPGGLISIALTRSSHRSLHTNNDAVKGVVLVQTKTKAQRVSIKFIGRTTCRVLNERSPGSHHVATADLFRHERTLSPRATPSANCPPGRVEYPFDFRFPEAVELDPGLQNDVPFKPDDSFEHEKGHQLPPSLWWNEFTVRNEYFLEADFVTAQRSFTLNPVVILQLRFTPSEPELSISAPAALLPVPPIRFERRSRPPTPEPGQERQGPLMRLKNSLKSEKNEEASSTSLLVLSAPPRYRVGATTALRISLQATLSDGLTQPAPVYLRGIRAQVFLHIKYRIPLSSAPNQEIRKANTEKFDLFNRRYSKPGLEITESTVVEDFVINNIVPPTFKTYGLATRYEVRYDLLLECAGKESEHEVEVKDVIIEPMTREGGHLGPPVDPPPRGSIDSTIPTMYGHLRPRTVTVWRPESPPPSYTQ